MAHTSRPKVTVNAALTYYPWPGIIAVIAAAARTGTALEINSFPDRLDLDGELVRRAMHAGVRFAISTDAHAVPHLDYLKFGVATAQRGWAGKADVINTYPLEKLRRFLAGKARPRPQTSLARRC